MRNNILVIYYSFEGNTKFVAENVAQTLNADLLELKPKEELNTHGFMKYVYGGRQAITRTILELNSFEIDLNNYELIIIGTPVWAFTYSPPIHSFLTSNQISNKKIALFCTHEGQSGFTIDQLTERLNNNQIIGSKDFRDVAKNKEKIGLESKEWAQSLIQ